MNLIIAISAFCGLGAESMPGTAYWQDVERGTISEALQKFEVCVASYSGLNRQVTDPVKHTQKLTYSVKATRDKFVLRHVKNVSTDGIPGSVETSYLWDSSWKNVDKVVYRFRDTLSGEDRLTAPNFSKTRIAIEFRFKSPVSRVSQLIDGPATKVMVLDTLPILFDSNDRCLETLKEIKKVCHALNPSVYFVDATPK